MKKMIVGGIALIGFSVACVGVYQLAMNKVDSSSETSVLVGVAILTLVCIFYKGEKKE